MARSANIYTGDGATENYAVNFTLGFISRGDVIAYVEDELDGGLNQIYRTIVWVNDGLITLNPAPADGKTVTIRRVMDKTVLQHDFQDGATQNEQSLDESNLQLVYIVHEILDGFYNTDDADPSDNSLILRADLALSGFTITGVGTPVNDDEIANKGYTDSLVGLTGDINTAVAAAALSESNAATSESNAAASAAATAADVLATAADKVATNADVVLTNADVVAAAASAAAALISEGNAATSESNASDSAAAALVSETNAGVSEVNAAASAASIVRDHNIIINGDMRVNQRAVVSWAAVSVGDYGWDRWKKTDASTIHQIVEDGNFRPSTEYTLSGTGVTTQQITAPASGDWTLPSIPNTATNVKLEIGAVATTYEPRSIAEELADCQRYYYKYFGFNFTGYGLGGAGEVMHIPFPVTMRTTPTVSTIGTPSFSNCSAGAGNGNSILGQSMQLYVVVTVTGGFQTSATLSSGFVYDAEL